MGTTHKLRVVTYNTHKCRGLDGRVRPQRIVEVLREINADIIGLQEVLSVSGAHPEKDQARFIASGLQLNHCVGKTRMYKGGVYGNVILTRLPVNAVHNYDITVRWREQRGCLRADLELNGGGLLHIFNVHLGTSYFERRQQARSLIDKKILHNEVLKGTRIVMGDFNEWTLGLTTRLLEEHFKSVDNSGFAQRFKSFPVFLPVLALDHIYYDAALELENVTVHRTPAALAASDHLPVVADFELHAPPVI